MTGRYFLMSEDGSILGETDNETTASAERARINLESLRYGGTVRVEVYESDGHGAFRPVEQDAR